MNRPDKHRVADGVDLALVLFWVAFILAAVAMPELLTLLSR